MSHLHINGYNMYYTDRGKGTAIIFIHPPVLTSLVFQYQIQPLSAHFRTITFDIRGHGSSESSKEEITYPLIVEDIRRLIERLKIDKAFLCGYSTGGSVVLEFLLTYPDLALGGIVIGGMSEVSDRKLKNKIRLGRIFSRIGAVSTIALSVAWAQAQTKMSLIRLLFKDAKKGNAKNATQYYQYSLHYNCTARLENIHQPVMLIYGEKDKSFHPYGKLLRQRLPKSELYYIKKVGHQIPTKAANKLNDLIHQFLLQAKDW
ncbi:alpha/beta hydrolase [Paenibacillus sp. 1011MAR3C5]|uniref:alpha/beta fold hydrolase n=1 Tax=Paenibacillus sp. 1011MAR3C5 TaxID=1675787 RepID=UPI000E6B5C61|nr:alpha/beta hydrolase [Paenibacillus sp. 1011MAR3C5]RJE82601.1 alpha/beta hydrolase [Paenibacillus sp. 1011MAR3C5]